MVEPMRASIVWESGMRFLAHANSEYELVLDSTARPGHLAASPMELMAIAVGGCTAMDVVAILQKMKQPLAGLEVQVDGVRAESIPKYFTDLKITYRIRGRGLDRDKVARAVALSHSTYCSALASLRPDCQVTSTLEIEDS
jgi:putative redox protein